MSALGLPLSPFSGALGFSGFFSATGAALPAAEPAAVSALAGVRSTV